MAAAARAQPTDPRQHRQLVQIIADAQRSAKYELDSNTFSELHAHLLGMGNHAFWLQEIMGKYAKQRLEGLSKGEMLTLDDAELNARWIDIGADRCIKEWKNRVSGNTIEWLTGSPVPEDLSARLRDFMEALACCEDGGCCGNDLGFNEIDLRQCPADLHKQYFPLLAACECVSEAAGVCAGCKSAAKSTAQRLDEATAVLFPKRLFKHSADQDAEQLKTVLQRRFEQFWERTTEQERSLNAKFQPDIVLTASSLAQAFGWARQGHGEAQIFADARNIDSVLRNHLKEHPLSHLSQEEQGALHKRACVKPWVIWNARSAKFELVWGVPVAVFRELLHLDKPVHTPSSSQLFDAFKRGFEMFDPVDFSTPTLDQDYRARFTPEFYPRRYKLRDDLYEQDLYVLQRLAKWELCRYKRSGVTYVEWSIGANDACRPWVMEHLCLLRVPGSMAARSARYVQRDAPFTGVTYRYLAGFSRSLIWRRESGEDLHHQLCRRDSELRQFCDELLSKNPLDLKHGEGEQAATSSVLVMLGQLKAVHRAFKVTCTLQEAARETCVPVGRALVGLDWFGDEQGRPFCVFANPSFSKVIQDIRSIAMGTPWVVQPLYWADRSALSYMSSNRTSPMVNVFGIRVHAGEIHMTKAVLESWGESDDPQVTAIKAHVDIAARHVLSLLEWCTITMAGQEQILLRIGHGVGFIDSDDPHLQRIRDKIVFELNFTSNDCLLLRDVIHLPKHYTVSCDNDGIWPLDRAPFYADRSVLIGVAAEFDTAWEQKELYSTRQGGDDAPASRHVCIETNIRCGQQFRFWKAIHGALSPALQHVAEQVLEHWHAGSSVRVLADSSIWYKRALLSEIQRQGYANHADSVQFVDVPCANRDDFGEAAMLWAAEAGCPPGSSLSKVVSAYFGRQGPIVRVPCFRGMRSWVGELRTSFASVPGDVPAIEFSTYHADGKSLSILEGEVACVELPMACLPKARLPDAFTVSSSAFSAEWVPQITKVDTSKLPAVDMTSNLKSMDCLQFLVHLACAVQAYALGSKALSGIRAWFARARGALESSEATLEHDLMRTCTEFIDGELLSAPTTASDAAPETLHESRARPAPCPRPGSKRRRGAAASGPTR